MGKTGPAGHQPSISMSQGKAVFYLDTFIMQRNTEFEDFG